MTDTIYALRLAASACTKIPYRGCEISIAMDDSCGAHQDYRRSDIRVYRDSDGADLTAAFLADGQHKLEATADNLKMIFAKIDEEMEKA